MELTTELTTETNTEFYAALKALSEYFAGSKSAEQEQLVIRTTEAYANRKRGGNAEIIEDVLW